MEANASGTDRPIVGIGAFRLDGHLRCLYLGAEKVKLTPKPFSTLEFLLKNRHRVVSKDELLQAVWGGVRDASTVEHAVSQLRQALGDDVTTPRYIETVPGQGYRFIAEVRDLARDPSAIAANNQAWPPTAEAAVPVASPPVAPRTARRLLTGAPVYYVLAALVLGGVIGAARLFKAPGAPERVTIAGASLKAWDSDGRTLWEHHFDQPARTLSAEEQDWRIRLVDLNGDGRREILAALFFPQSRDQGFEELYCFAPTGKLLWRYRPDHAVRFVSRGFSGPWRFLDLVLVPEGNRQTVWVAVNDAVWWPGLLVSIEGNGNRTVRFVSSGVIYALHVVKNADGTFVLAGGVNNEYCKPSLTIIKTDQTPVASPQTPGSGYQCLECPTGRPYRYFLFPRSEVNVKAGLPYSLMSSIRQYNGRTLLDINEGLGVFSARDLFEMSADFAPQNVTYGDGHKEAHQLLEERGRIDHTWEECREQKTPAIVQSWDTAHGWTEIPVPWVR